MKHEKPVKIIPGRGKHKTEQRVFARNIHETYCVDKSCKFYNKPAAQGICHTTNPSVEGCDWEYIDGAQQAAEAYLKSLKRMHKSKGDKEYLRYLESSVVCTWMNNLFMLDELVRLRSENSLLKVRLEN